MDYSEKSNKNSLDAKDEIGYFLLYEMDRKIKDILNAVERERTNAGSSKGLLKGITNLFADRGDKKQPKTVIDIAEQNTPAYIRFRELSSVIPYNMRSLEAYGDDGRFLPEIPRKGNLALFSFSVLPVPISFNNNTFIITPHYVFKFDSNGMYICTYSPLAIAADLVTYSITEKKEIRVNRQRSRFRSNLQQSLPQSRNIIENVLKIEIADHVMYFYSGLNECSDAMEAIQSYSETETIEKYDAAYHIIELLKRCDIESKQVKRLENLFYKSITKG